MKVKQIITGFPFLLLILSLASCAPEVVTDQEYGFLAGLWHGLTITFSLIGSFFDSSISLLAETNSGFFYYTGWAIGIIISIPIELILTFLLFGILFGSD